MRKHGIGRFALFPPKTFPLYMLGMLQE